MKNLVKFTALLVILMIGATACYKYNDTIYLDELDITLTYYDTTFDFKPYKTFAVRDSVGILTNYLEDDDIDNFYKSGGASDQIRNYVIQKFTELGYTKVDTSENYDFGVNLVSAFVNTTTVVSYPGWWWGYGGYNGWYGGYWPPYGGYPWYTTVYQTQTGSVLVEMVDGVSLREYQAFIEGKTDDELDQIPPDQFPEVYFRWQSIVSGVLGSSADYNQDRGKRGIDEAFDQSPYLKKNDL